MSFREQEKFLYDYDFGDNWQHQIHVEAKTLLNGVQQTFVEQQICQYLQQIAILPNSSKA